MAAACISMVYQYTFVNAIINKSDKLMYSLFGLMAIIGGLHYFGNHRCLLDFGAHFLDCIKNIEASMDIPIVVLLVLAIYTFSFIKKNLYLDRGLEIEKAAEKPKHYFPQ